MILKNKRILITGGHGFVGSKLYELLKKKNNVKKFGRYDKKEKITATNLKKINSYFDIIIHTAGGSSVSKSIENPKEDFKKTVNSTRAIIDYIRFNKKKIKLIFISSPAVFGNFVKKEIYKPISPYGKNKLIAEKLLIKFSKKLNFDLTIIRFFSLYGEGLKKQLLWDTLSKLKKNLYEFFGTGNEKRSWMHINDAIKIVNLSTIKSNKKINIINAPGNQILTNRQVVNMIYENCKIKRKPFFNNIIRKGDPSQQVSNNNSLKNLGWKQKINFSSGLRKYIKWFKKK